MRTIFHFLFCLILTSQYGRRHVPWSAACVFSCSVLRVPLCSRPLPLNVRYAGFFLLRAQSDLSQALPEHDLAALVPQDFSRIVVNPFLRGRDLRRADLGEICAFRMPPQVLIRSTICIIRLFILQVISSTPGYTVQVLRICSTRWRRQSACLSR